MAIRDGSIITSYRWGVEEAKVWEDGGGGIAHYDVAQWKVVSLNKKTTRTGNLKPRHRIVPISNVELYKS